MKKALSLLLVFVMLICMMSMTALASENEANLWEGKSAVFVGDSITYGVGTTKLYYEYLDESLGFSSVTAMGVSGSCFSTASNYGMTREPLITRYQNIPSADLIVVFMGTNDYGHETPLGTENDTEDGTFYGALNVIIPALVSTHTSSKIVFVTSLHRYGYGTSGILGTKFTYDNIPNGVGATLEDYVSAVKTVCIKNGVSVIDLFAECTLDPTNAEVRSKYMPDGVHPNAAGHEVIAGIMESHIRGYEPVEGEPVVQTEMIHGNKFAPGNNQSCRASSRINFYLKAGTVITLKNPDVMQWACAKTSNEFSSNNLGYFPDSQWTDKVTAVVAEDGWIGFTFKYRDETQSFDLTKPLSDYITIEEPHTHTYTPTVTPPTCTEQGYTTYTCACGDSYVDDYVDAEGEHDFTDWYTTKEAAYNADGEESRDCTKCSHVEFRSVKLEVVTSGNVGYGTPYTDEVTYTLYIDGTMVISGQGKVYCSDWRGDYQPYKDYRTQVKTLIVEEGITSTSGGCFAHFYNLETVILPSSLTQINNNAFMSSFSSSITSITIPETVTYIGAYSYGFYYGKGGTTFTDIIIENPNVRFVDNKAVFNAGNNLANLTLYTYGANNNVSAYAQKYGCKYVDLESYKTGVYAGVEYMYYDGVLTLSAAQNDAIIAGEDAPWNTEKNNVRKIVIESGITGISANAFKDYYNLESIEINNEIRFVGDGAFSTTESCDRALTLALPRTVKSVGSGIFDGRQNVTLTAYLGSAAAEINAPGVNLDLKKQFKLLLIGNSYSEDASSCGQGMTESQLLNILQAMLGEDAEVTVALLGSGGKGVNWHATQAEQGNSAYSFKIISSNSPTWTTIGSASSYQALTWTDWDVVSLQPYNISASTGIEAVAYPDSTDAKFRDLETASEYMLDYIGTHAPDAEIYCYMHWAQTSSTTLNANLSYYNRLAPHYLGMMEHTGNATGTKYTSIIPVGLSIQNARTTYLALLAYNTSAYDDGDLNLTTDAQIGLQRDGGHLSFNIGRYIAGLTFAEMIVPEEMRVDGYKLPDIRVTESLGELPKEYTEIAQKSVSAAVESWRNGSLAVTNIEGYTEDPTDAAKQMIESMNLNLNCGDAISIEQQIRNLVFAALPADFAIETVVVGTNTYIAAVTLRFGYTSVIVEINYNIASHDYKNGICTGCGETCESVGHVYKDEFDAFCDGCNAIREINYPADKVELREIDGVKYIYVNGRTSVEGLFKVGDDYYCATWGGVVLTGDQYVHLSYCDKPAGRHFYFSEDGKMLNKGFVTGDDGIKRLYVDGRTSVEGLFEVDGKYYLATWGGVVLTDGRFYISESFVDGIDGGRNFTVGSDGKILDGVVEIDGQKYYYDFGTTVFPGIYEIDGIEYTVTWGGLIEE